MSRAQQPQGPATDVPENERNWLPDERSSLKRRSIRGGAVTLVSQALQLGIQMGSTVVLARLLTPADFGLIAMVTAVTALGFAVKELGLGTATIQRMSITRDQVSALFWVNVLVGIFLTMVAASLAPALAWFYDEPRLVAITAWMSLIFLFGSLGTQHTAVLMRDMRFLPVELVRIVSMVIAAVVAIVAALKGWGCWALVINYLGATLLNVVGVWVVGRWLPGRPRRTPGLRSLLGFGLHITGFEVVNYFSRNLDRILIGRLAGAVSLGYYSKAYTLMMMPISNLRAPMNTVALPALSRLQDHPEKFRRYFVYQASILAFACMPLVVFMGLYAEPLILLVLGDQWSEAAQLFKILAVAAFIQPVASLAGVVLMAVGAGQRYFRIGLAYAIVFSAAFAIGIAWGPKGVAVAYAAANYLLLWPGLTYAFNETPLRIADFFRAVFKPAVSSLVAGLCLLGGHASLGTLHALLFWPASLCLFGCVYLIAYGCLPGGTGELKRYLSWFWLAVPRFGRAPAAL